MIWGSKAKLVVARLQADGYPVPDNLRQPEITQGGESVIAAFWTLSPDRPAGFVLGHIPFTAIDRYAVRFGINSPDDFCLFLRLIRALDTKYLEIIRMQQDQNKGGKK